MSDWRSVVPQNMLNRYELYNFNHAVEILTQAYPLEFHDIVSSLAALSISTDDILQGGGNESSIPKKLSALLRPLDWQEVKIEVEPSFCITRD